MTTQASRPQTERSKSPQGFEAYRLAGPRSSEVIGLERHEQCGEPFTIRASKTTHSTFYCTLPIEHEGEHDLDRI